MIRRVVAGVASALVLALAGLLLTADRAAAHALLLASAPADGARLESSPTEVSLSFNEDVSTVADALRVFDSEGERVDRGALRLDGAELAIDLQPDLPDGSYVATYRVTSADGHPVRGGIVFAVGDAEADAGLLDQVFDDGGDRVWSILGAVGRWFVLVGSLGAAGVAIAAARGPVRAPRTPGLTTTLAAVAFVGTVVVFVTQAALLTGGGLSSLSEGGVAEAVWSDGAVGLSLLVALAGAALAVVVGRGEVPVVPGAAVSGLAVAVAAGLSGHSRSGDSEIAAIASSSIHAGVVAIWLGGLIVGAFGAWATATDRLAHLRRFSTWAAASVVVVAVSGVVMIRREVRAVDAFDTAYGWTLIIKVIGVGAVLLLAARVRRSLSVDDDGDGGGATRSRILRVEAVGLVAVLAVTAVLVNVTPARVAAGIGEIAATTIDLGESGRIDVVVDPADPGATNTVHFYVFDNTGRVADLVEEAVVSLSLPDAEIGPIIREPERAGPAHFILVGDELVLAGEWQIDVQVRQSRFSSASGTGRVVVR